MTAQNLRKPLEGFARGLLATTCLTAVCGFTAKATTITEGVPPAPTDFPGEFAAATMLPIGTNVVNGTLGFLPNEGGFDSTDYFEFNHLTAGAPFTFKAFYSPSEQEGAPQVFSDLDKSDGTLLNEGPLNQTYTGVVPTDGNLVVGLFAEAGEFCGANQSSAISGATVQCAVANAAHPKSFQPFFGEGAAAYQVTLEVGSAPSTVPEPGTLPAAGLALGAGALLWARRNKE